MTFIVPFIGEFCGEARKIYSVNNDNPTGSISSHITTAGKCWHCGETHFFRVYEPKEVEEDIEFVTEVFDCKCPSCRKEFDLEIETEI